MRRRGFVQTDSYLLAACFILACLTPPTRGPDAQLRRTVLTHLADDAITARLSLKVTVSGGVATISGVVDDRSDEARALSTVRGTEGVLDVIGDIRISDEVIADRVRRALSGHPAVATVPVLVTCEDGVVILRSDRTNADQRKMLKGIALAVDDVVSVVDEMK